MLVLPEKLSQAGKIHELLQQILITHFVHNTMKSTVLQEYQTPSLSSQSFESYGERRHLSNNYTNKCEIEAMLSVATENTAT